MLNLKYDTSEHLYETERLTDTKIRPAFAKGKTGKDCEQTQTVVYRMDKQQGYYTISILYPFYRMDKQQG